MQMGARQRHCGVGARPSGQRGGIRGAAGAQVQPHEARLMSSSHAQIVRQRSQAPRRLRFNAISSAVAQIRESPSCVVSGQIEHIHP